MAKKKTEVVPETPLLPFHELFPVHLKYTDGKEAKNCYFKDEVDLKKYIARYKLKAKGYTVSKTEPKNKG
jgi:hypothetical protein